MAKPKQALTVSLKFTLWETVQLYLLLTAQTGTWAQNDLYREISANILPSSEDKGRFKWSESCDLSGRMLVAVEKDNFNDELSCRIPIAQWRLLFTTAEAWRFWPASSDSAKLQAKMIAVNERVME